MGGHGIVGAQIAMGAGVAFAEKYNKTDNVAFVSMGDGAVRQGALHETFNMAMMWKLPAVFIIENNNYAMGTSVERTTNVTDLSKLGLSYEMPSRAVNGMRPEDVHEAIDEAASRARRGDGPTLLDIRTYRYKGHSMSDPQKYRTKDEVGEWVDQDPIDHVLKVIKENKWLSDAKIKEIQDLELTIQQYQQEEQIRLQQKEQEMLQIIYEKIQSAVNEVAKETGCAYVLQSDGAVPTVLFDSGPNSYDITDLVKKKLNL